jgi:putative ABC transport system substrate-binding protein
LLKEAVPRLKRVAVILNLLNPNSAAPLGELEVAAKRMKLEFHSFGVKAFEELPDAFSAIAKARAEAVVVGEDPLFNSNAGAIAALAMANRLPASGFTNFADAGGLLGYGANRPLVYGRAAYFADKIFKGAKPGDLPIERATTFELIVNLRIAKVLGIKIPQELLQRANRVIQ